MPGQGPEDERAGGPPPDPSDRAWVHPTEMTSFVASSRLASGRRSRWTALATGLAVVVALAGVVFAMTVGESSHRSAVRIGAVQRIAATVAPSVVAVRIARDGQPGRASGVCVNAGQVVTSAHALDGATSISVVTADGRTFPAVAAGSDPVSDLALLTVDAGTTRPAALGASQDLAPGQQVIGVAVSASGRHRWVDTGEIASFNRIFVWGEGVSVPGLIETDMTASEEHSGGALVDSRGSVVGILVVPPDASTAGLALPIDEARDVATQLGAQGHAEHGWLGVLAADAADRPGGGARVQAVLPAGPADRAGLAQGDVIVEVGRGTSTTAISSMAQLMAEVGRRKPGERVDVTLYRETGKRRVTVKLGDQNDAGSATFGPGTPGNTQ